MNLMSSSGGGFEIPTIYPTVVFYIGKFPVTATMISALVTTLALIIFALVIRIFFIPKWRVNNEHKSGFRLFLEAIVNMFEGVATDQTGHYKNSVAPFYFSFAAFIMIGTLMEVFGLRPPTSDLSATLTMGIFTFGFVFIYGIRKSKGKRFLRYLNPLNTISDLVVPFSLALRMFGSVLSGYIVMHLIYALPWQALFWGIPAIGTAMFTLFHAIIQSYVFMFLSMCFVGEAVE